MISVFGSFILNDDPTIKQFGLGLATAVAIDAIVVCIFVPALITVSGRSDALVPPLARSDRAPHQHRGRGVLRAAVCQTGGRARSGRPWQVARLPYDDTVIALVTGASSGIGEATARRLAREPGAPAGAGRAARGPPAGAGGRARRRDRGRGRPAGRGRAAAHRARWSSGARSPRPAREQRRRGLARAVRRGRMGERAAAHGAQLRRGRAADRGAAATASPLGAELDRERREHRGPGRRAATRAATRRASSR